MHVHCLFRSSLCPSLWCVMDADSNEVEIVRGGGLAPILAGAQTPSPDLQAQCARALRNLSVSGE